MTIKKYIPNLLTLLNLFCGSIAVIYVINNNFVAGAIFMFLGIFFDFFDGFAARALKAQSAIGLQLDSLADMVTSGLVPGIVMFKLFEVVVSDWGEVDLSKDFGIPLFPLAGLFITLASAYRLAKFNVDEEQQTYFKGLPTPANAILIMSFPLILEFQNNDIMNSIILNKWFLIAITLLSCFLLNAKIKLFALKFSDWSFQTNSNKYIFILLSIVMLIVLKFAAIPAIILLYISMSILSNISSKS